MRLLRINAADQFSLVEFNGSEIPPYAILSHTWGADDDEVTYRDMVDETGKDKIGYKKILFCATRAIHDGLTYFWVDTCCIDKSSSAELTESTNSMFQWYKDAAVCYVTLMDLRPRANLQVELPHCLWFTRGWTLQELLAPQTVEFYDATGTHVGSKQTLKGELSSITGIEWWHLNGRNLSSASVATKMSWAARRKTKRIEDWSYSMLGIFDVNMPLIYGEGMKAFRRLQEEIIKRSNDLTIFAWNFPHDVDTSMRPYRYLISPLASSPAAFTQSHSVIRYTDYFPEFTLTNQSLLLSGDVDLRLVEVGNSNDCQLRYAVFVGTVGRVNSTMGSNGAIILHKIGPKLFCRDGTLGFGTDFRQISVFNVRETRILLDSRHASHRAHLNRIRGLHVPVNPRAQLELTYPETLWDETDRVFLEPKFLFRDPVVLVMKFRVMLEHMTVPLAVLCYHRPDVDHELKVFTRDQNS